VSVPHWYLDEGHLDWGYALTGHKAQGATARRAHTVAGDGVDREWIYVTMSRGREANTIYLTDPDMSHDECEHLAHQHPDRLPALIAALGRSAAEPAAIETGRGPHTLTDEDLDRRRADLKAALGMRGAERHPSAAGGDHRELIAEYLNLHHEAHHRHQDRLATMAYAPPEWITDTLGERPAESDRRAAWDAIVDRTVRYRTEQLIPDEAPELLGPVPPSGEVEQRVAWIAARRDIERDLADLVAEHQGRAAVGR
jgi:hypothetical protein